MKHFLVLALAIACAQAEPMQGRITNGHAAAEGQFPYQVGLSIAKAGDTFFCGASIIGNQWLLTAAHCIVGADNAIVYYGATQRTTAKLYQVVYPAGFIPHPDYTAKPLTNDIALIKTPVIAFSAYINKVQLPALASSYATYAGQQAIASGWGFTSQWDFDYANTLQYTSLSIISAAKCEDAYGKVEASSKVLCVATPNKSSTCSGDLGGPLVLSSSKQLVGVASFTHIYGCERGEPAGFARVTSYLHWIKEVSGISY
ncbi:serine protease 3-like [Drosophila busckii]|uniref:serine protease 3-like n=1 Tax=Drosophila busckii TaxID=30019 RepID=UPI00083EAA34|nr:serine protease 3-like [Drosophila busckii]